MTAEKDSIQIISLALNATSKSTNQRSLIMRSRNGTSYLNQSTLIASAVQLEFYQVYLSDTQINATQSFGTNSPSLVLYTNTTLNSTRNLQLFSAYGGIALLADKGFALSSGFNISSPQADILITSKGLIYLQNGTVNATTVKIDA